MLDSGCVVLSASGAELVCDGGSGPGPSTCAPACAPPCAKGPALLPASLPRNQLPASGRAPVPFQCASLGHLTLPAIEPRCQDPGLHLRAPPTPYPHPHPHTPDPGQVLYCFSGLSFLSCKSTGLHSSTCFPVQLLTFSVSLSHPGPSLDPRTGWASSL